MSRHQGSSGKNKMSGRSDERTRPDSNTSGRGGEFAKNKSYARGNAPLRKPTKDVKAGAEQKPRPAKRDNDAIRLNKYISNSGICSRRDADMHIAAGNVTVNGKVVTEMGYKVKFDDEVRFDGARVHPEKKAYVLLNKPKGFASTNSEGKGRTVMELVANSGASRIRPIGRLGRNSVGLILFTNDEVLVEKFTNSKHGVPRLFQIELDKNLKFEDFKKIQAGIKIEDKTVTVEEISYIDGASKNQIGLKIKNTGNSIIRSIFDHLKYEIVKLDCVSIAELTKKDLSRGQWRYLTDQEVINLKMMR